MNQSILRAGSVSERDWTDKEGNKRKSMDVRVNEVALQGNKQSTIEQNFSAPKPASKSVDFDQDIPF